MGADTVIALPPRAPRAARMASPPRTRLQVAHANPQRVTIVTPSGHRHGLGRALATVLIDSVADHLIVRLDDGFTTMLAPIAWCQDASAAPSPAANAEPASAEPSNATQAADARCGTCDHCSIRGAARPRCDRLGCTVDFDSTCPHWVNWVGAEPPA